MRLSGEQRHGALWEHKQTAMADIPPSRQEKSLGLLTSKFVSLLQEAEDGVLDIKSVSEGGGGHGGGEARCCWHAPSTPPLAGPCTAPQPMLTQASPASTHFLALSPGSSCPCGIGYECNKVRHGNNARGSSGPWPGQAQAWPCLCVVTARAKPASVVDRGVGWGCTPHEGVGLRCLFSWVLDGGTPDHPGQLITLSLHPIEPPLPLISQKPN